MTDYIQVFTTTDKKENAQEISRELVKRRLAACVQVVGPITSTFWWKDNIDEEEEWLLIIKTRNSLYAELEEAIKGAHTYEVPEIIASPVVAGNKDYFDWLEKETR